MKIFLDTANVAELREGVSMGLVDGCTTNPSLIAKEKRPFRPLVEEICSIVSGDVSLEVVATDFDGMIKEGKELAQVAPERRRQVSADQGRPQGRQAPLRRRASASTRRSASPRPRRCSRPRRARPTSARSSAGSTTSAPSGMDLVRDICQIYANYGFKTQVLAASIRNPLHVVDAAKAGAHVATMPFAVLEMLMKHPLTDIGLKKFLDDWNKSGAKI